MQGYVNCIAHRSSEGQLIIGESHAALFDCGMAFCADETIKNIKSALKKRTLDYIFLTHTHYDHIGALPYFIREWPHVQIVTSKQGDAVMRRDTPRRVIRDLSVCAARMYGASHCPVYDDDNFYATSTVEDKDVIPLGGMSVMALKTPGHTRDHLSYFIPEPGLLIPGETPGVLTPDGVMHACYLTSYKDTIDSIKRIRNLPYHFLALPHRGIASCEDVSGYFDRALKTNAACRDFILEMKDKNLSEDDMQNLFYQKYSSETLLSFQPKEAFYANARAVIACTIREFENV